MTTIDEEIKLLQTAQQTVTSPNAMTEAERIRLSWTIMVTLTRLREIKAQQEREIGHD